MKRISTRSEQVAVWVDSFSVCAHMAIAMDEMYEIIENEEQESTGTSKGYTLHREDRKNRRKMDKANRRRLAIELVKYSHPLNDKHPSLHNMTNGVTDHWSDTPLVRHTIGPTHHWSDTLWSDTPLVRHTISPTHHLSDTPLVRHTIGPTHHWSDKP